MSALAIMAGLGAGWYLEKVIDRFAKDVYQSLSLSVALSSFIIMLAI